MIVPDPRDVEFKTLAAPGLDEDDLYAALHGLPVPSPFWGEGGATPSRRDDGSWDEAAERRRRHEEVLRKWEDRPGAP